MLKNKNLFILSFLISLITILFYLPVLENNFVNWDDDEYIYENPNIQSLGIKSVQWMFTAFHSANWHPLSWLSHSVDYAIWGLNPAGHHLTSIIFHGLNTFLVVLLILRLMNYGNDGNQESLPPAHSRNSSVLSVAAGAVTGLLFGLHPLHVESVAWVSERKDVLYAFFFLLSILSYVQYVSSAVRKERTLQYSLCLLFFTLSLMSKPMAVTLPAVLIVLDRYPFRRFELQSAFLSKRGVLIEKIPFVVLSAAASVVTVMAQKETGAMKNTDVLNMGDRILVAIRTFSFYLYKIVVPKDLAPLYPYPARVSFFTTEYVISCASVVIITVFCILSWRKQKIWLTVWAYYLITLLPVSGIIRAGEQAAADRYTYLASLGPFLLIGSGVGLFIQKARAKTDGSAHKRVFGIIAVTTVLLAFFASLTISQIKIWKDSITLWNYELTLFPDSAFKAYYNLGRFYSSQGLIDRAIREYNNALRINPYFLTAQNDIGVAYKRLGLIDKAIEHYRYAIKIDSTNSIVYNNLGNAYQAKGLFDKAVRQYEIALQLKPDLFEAQYNLGFTYLAKGLTDKAMQHLQTALRLNPDDADVHYSIGRAYQSKGLPARAKRHFSTAQRLQSAVLKGTNTKR